MSYDFKTLNDSFKRIFGPLAEQLDRERAEMEASLTPAQLELLRQMEAEAQAWALERAMRGVEVDADTISAEDFE